MQRGGLARGRCGGPDPTLYRRDRAGGPPHTLVHTDEGHIRARGGTGSAVPLALHKNVQVRASPHASACAFACESPHVHRRVHQSMQGLGMATHQSSVTVGRSSRRLECVYMHTYTCTHIRNRRPHCALRRVLHVCPPTGRQADRQAGRQAGRQADRQAGREAGRWAGR